MNWSKNCKFAENIDGVVTVPTKLCFSYVELSDDMAQLQEQKKKKLLVHLETQMLLF